MKNKLIILVTLVLGIAYNGFSQIKSNKEIKGDKYAFRYLYDDAIDAYKSAKNLTPEGQRKLAQCYLKMGKESESEEVYFKLISSNAGLIPDDYYRYAMALKRNGKYEEAAKSMESFSKLQPMDLRAKDFQLHKDDLADMMKDDGKYKLAIAATNTADQDFGTSFYKKNIVFTSTRSKVKMIKRTYNGNGKPFLNMYVADANNGQLSNPKVFVKSLDGKMHDGPASFNKQGTYMAFTRNHYNDKSKDKIVELQIYFSTFDGVKWAKPTAFQYNDESYSVGHPCLSPDGNSMYFVSAIPGGFGGTDIYLTSKDKNGQWSKPVNCGDQINTEADELFPFYEDSTKTLLYSSNGKFGLGGQDIFIANWSGSEFINVHNAGAPLNTKRDDFAAIVDAKTNKGYFSSNREGGSGSDDIYGLEFLKGLDARKRLEGIAKDINSLAIPNVFVTLYNENGDILDTLTTKDDAKYLFMVESNKNYKLIGKKEKFMDGENTANTFDKEMIVSVDLTLLTKQEIIAQKIEVETDLVKILELNNIYFDLDKYNIRPDAEIELNKIVAIMNEYP